MVFFEVSENEISRLNERQLHDLLRRLLNLEAEKHGVWKSGINVSLNTKAPDGGIDASIKWEGGPERTDHIIGRHVGYQCKATRMTSTDAGKEVENRKQNLHTIKPRVDEVLSEGGAYVLFTTTHLNDQQRHDAVESIRTKLHEHQKPYADSATIDVYDCSKIKTWVNSYLPAIVTVKGFVGSPIDDGLQTLAMWGESLGLANSEYCSDDKISRLLNDISGNASKPGHVMRIVGLSGRGKTRLVYEALKRENYGLLSQRVVYVDAADGSFELPRRIPLWMQRGFQLTLVVDNCDPLLHRELEKYVINTESALITLDHNPDENVCDNTYQMPPASDAVIEAIVRQSFPHLDDSSLRRIKEFADGFPLIAVKLAEDLRGRRGDIGNLRDDNIMRRLLGNLGENHIRAIKACALFEHVGFDGNWATQYKFIAKNIAGQDPDQFYRCITGYKKRGLIDKRGDFIRVIPRPLAVRLAADWWEENSTDHIRSVLELLNPVKAPPGLSDAFCKAIPKLSFSQKANELTEELCGAQGPFGQAEALQSSWGSRLFRAMVEVNPVATTDAIYRIVSSLNTEELHSNFIGDARRNLVWALEKLCFRAECFSKAAWVMLRLAAAENESWSNNATGQFLQLFQTFLSGTEAEPKLRFKLIDRAFKEKDEKIHALAVKALGKAIGTYHFRRSGGSEEQGSAPSLQDWRPQIWQDAFDYWEEALKRLVSIAIYSGPLCDLAKSAIAEGIYGLVQHGRIDALESAISQIVLAHGSYWPDALKTVKRIKSLYNTGKMPPIALETLKHWETLLTPTDFDERIKLLVCTPPWEHEKDNSGRYIDIAARSAERFAEECVSTPESLVPHLTLLVSGELRQGAAFGRTVIEKTKEPSFWMDSLLEELVNCEKGNANPIVIAAALSKLQQINSSLYEEYLSRFENDDRLKPFYIAIVAMCNPSSKELESTTKLILDGFIDIAKAKVFAYGRILAPLSVVDVNKFCLKLAEINPAGVWVGLEVLYMFCHDAPDKWRDSQHAFNHILKMIDFKRIESSSDLDLMYWVWVIEESLKNSQAVPVEEIVNSIFALVKDVNVVSIQDSHIQSILSLLVDKGFGEYVWNEVTKVLQNGEVGELWRLEVLLTSGKVDGEQQHLMFKLPEDYLLDWAAQHLEFGPKFIARATPIYQKDKNGNVIVSPFAEKIIVRFGDNKDVLSALSSFAGFKSWSGSRVPSLKDEEIAYTHFENHANENVRVWATQNLQYIRKTIADETKRDEENEWDIY